MPIFLNEAKQIINDWLIKKGESLSTDELIEIARLTGASIKHLRKTECQAQKRIDPEGY